MKTIKFFIGAGIASLLAAVFYTGEWVIAPSVFLGVACLVLAGILELARLAWRGRQRRRHSYRRYPPYWR